MTSPTDDRNRPRGNMPDKPALAAAPSAAWGIAATIVLALTGFIVTFTYVWDSDVLTHLACGYWMLQHKQVLGTDPFSIDPLPQWVNVHWLFQLTIAWLHRLGGFEILSVLKAGLAGSTLLAFAIALRKKVSPALLVACGLAMLVTIAGRVRVRPEAFTLLYMMLTILLMETVRQGASPRRLWWLVPIMILWVNMHGIFILGLGIMWAALIGAAVDHVMGRREVSRNLLIIPVLCPLIVATAACFISPWPIDAAVHPLLLWTRVSGQNEYYSFGVSELQPTYLALGAAKGALCFAGATAAVMLLNFRRVPIGHVLWLAAMLGLALTARRNIGLLGPVCGVLLALHAQTVLANIAKKRTSLAVLVRPAAVLAMLLAVTMALGTATEWSFRQEHRTMRFGPGLLREEFPIDLAIFLRDLKADGDILFNDFGDAGAFEYYGSVGRLEPRRLVYMDGRLEAHDLARFKDQHRMQIELQNPQSALRVELPPSVRFVVIRQNAQAALSALAQSERFQLIHLDDVAACFVDTNWKPRFLSPLPPDVLNLDDYDHKLSADMTIDVVPPVQRTWYRQNPLSHLLRLGEGFLYLGQFSKEPIEQQSPTRYRCSLLAKRYLAAAQAEGIVDADIAMGLLAQACQQRAYRNRFDPSAAVPVNIDVARALRLYSRLDLTKLSDPDILAFAEQRVRTLLLDGQIDAAHDAILKFLQNLPARQQVSPPPAYRELRNAIDQRLDQSRSAVLGVIKKYSPLERAEILANANVGLVDLAIEELSAETSDAALLRRADLLLRQGRTDQARATYRQCHLAADAQWRADLGLALCDWADGQPHRAAAEMMDIIKGHPQPLVGFYLADALEEIGDYATARKIIDHAHSSDEQLNALLERNRQRLLVHVELPVASSQSSQ